MKKMLLALVLSTLLGSALSSFAIDVTMDKFGVTIETHLYELFWSADTGNGMGYADVTFKELAGELMSGGSLFHRVDYRGGRSAWGAMIEKESEILEQDLNAVTVQYMSHDGKSFEYTCIATYWEALPFFRHEVTVTNDGPEDQAWPITGDDPMMIPGGAIIAFDNAAEGGVFPFDAGMQFVGDLDNRDFSDDLRKEFENQKIVPSTSVMVLIGTVGEEWVIQDRTDGLRYLAKIEGNKLNVYKYPMAYWKEPLPHIAYWTDEGFAGLYSSDSKARLKFGDWQGTGDMIRLDHGISSTNVKRKTTSPPLVYYVGFGVGGADEAHDLATEVVENPGGFAVQPIRKLSTTWGAVRAAY